MGRKHEVNNSDLWVILRGHSAPTATAFPPRPPSLRTRHCGLNNRMCQRIVTWPNLAEWFSNRKSTQNDAKTHHYA